LPGNISNTKKVLKFIAEQLSQDTYVSLMSQYHNAHKSSEFKELSSGLTVQEYQEAVDYLAELNLKNGWIQDLGE